jgi:pimeloyl-ACP methyl ester carboxylesterase
VQVRRSVLIAVVVPLFAACTGGGSSQSSLPSYSVAPCPRDVQVHLLVRHSCGYLTVLEDRSRPDVRTLKLFVLRIPPPDVRPRPDPVLILGDDVGALPDYGKHQGEAQRLHRVVYVLDQRGTGHSLPGLSCPEVDPLSTEGLTEPTGDPSLRRRFLAAVTACRSRLLSAGIDPSRFDLTAMAADVEDLRRGLGVSSWNLASYGSLSRLALEVIREDPGHVRAAYLDSPQFPQLDEPSEMVLGTGLMLNGLLGACGNDRSCRERYPRLEEQLSAAIEQLAAHPIEAHTPLGDIVVDAGSFLHALQVVLAEDSGTNLPQFPAFIVDAVHHHVGIDVTTALATQGSLCAGYRFGCTAHFSFGVYLSVLCRDEAPFIDSSTLPRVATPLPGLAERYGTGPYLAACSAWKMPSAPPTMHAPVHSVVPVLLLSGQFDPFSPPRLTSEFGDSLENSFSIEVPAHSHTPLLSIGCAVQIRDVWMQNPSSPPIGTGCLRGLSLEFVTHQEH